MQPIPRDIWLHVARFIPGHDLRSMLTINSAFFQLAMDARYHKIVFNDDVEGNWLRIRRLRDPEISRRVRRLYMFPSSFSEYVMEPEDLERFIQSLTNTVISLTNVNFFYINWTGSSPSVEQLLPFLNAAWNAFGPSVQSVVLHMAFHHLPALIPTTDGPMGLRNLEVVIYDSINIPRERKIETLAPAVTACASFINRVAPTLHKLFLAILLYGFEVSSLFCQLGNIPNLERFQISADKDPSIMSNVLGLPHFLCNHAETLHHVLWTGACLSEKYLEQASSRNGLSKEQRLVNWLSGNALDKLFSNLITLHLPVPASPTGVSLVQRHLRRSSDTLTSLMLWDHYMTYDEVNTLLSAFIPRRKGYLRELGLQVEILSPELVLLLARIFPQLEKLSMDISYAAARDGGQQRNPRNVVETLSLARNFAEAMRKRDFRSWPLYSIRITTSRSFDMNLCDQLMLLLAECIPSVERFGELDKEYLVRDHGRVFP